MLEFDVEKIPLHDASRITLETLAQLCAMKVYELEELMDYNALQPVSCDVSELLFFSRWISPLRTVAKLRIDFDLDMFTVAIVLSHIQRISQLEQQVAWLEARLPESFRSDAFSSGVFTNPISQDFDSL